MLFSSSGRMSSFQDEDIGSIPIKSIIFYKAYRLVVDYTSHNGVTLVRFHLSLKRGFSSKVEFMFCKYKIRVQFPKTPRQRSAVMATYRTHHSLLQVQILSLLFLCNSLMVEHISVKYRVTGSSPVYRAFYRPGSSTVE